MFTTQPALGVMGEPLHCIPVSHREMALSLFEAALDLDDDARLFQVKDAWHVAFSSSPDEAKEAIQAARLRTNPRYTKPLFTS